MAENGEQDPLMINSNEGQALEEDKKEEADGQARKKDVCHICFQHFGSVKSLPTIKRGFSLIMSYNVLVSTFGSGSSQFQARSATLN